METVGRGYEIAASRAPSERERAALEARRAALGQSLEPADPADVKRALGRLFSVMASQRLTEEEAVELVQSYAKILRGEPFWAILAACQGVIDSGAEFRPAAPALLKRAREAAQRARDELHEIDRLLGATVYREPDADERKRVSARFAGALAQLEATAGPPEKAAPTSGPMDWETRERLMRERATEPVRLSERCLNATWPGLRREASG